LPSTLTTDPIGPRSVDEMLDVVYGRATRLRRRRAIQRIGGATAALALALGFLVSSGDGTDDAQVRVVDRPGHQDEAPPPDEPAASDVPPPATGDGGGAGAASGAAPRPTATGTPEAPAKPTPDGAVGALPVADKAPSIELWATATDGENDAVPNDWYYDVVSAAMEFDRSRAAVVFTTRYRTPDAPADEARETRILESDFAYGSHTYAVTVQESGNRLGVVQLEGEVDCGACSARFDVGAATLVVTVPLDALNEQVRRFDDSEPLGAGADVSDLVAITTKAQGELPPVKADVSGEGAL
jgi:hypothetical protein